MNGGFDMKIWKKNIIAAAILVTVCGGIYINWLYNEDLATANLTDTLDADKLLSSDTLVMSDSSIDEAANTGSDYFAAVRLSRQEARDGALTQLQEAMAYENKESGNQSSQQLEKIVDVS
jgi:stage III sporulation protein AH